MPRQRKKRRRGPVQYQGPRRAKPPFPVNLIFNVKFFYVTFIVVMIASMAAVGLGSGLGAQKPKPAEVPEDEQLAPEATPNPFVFDSAPAVIDATKLYMATLQTNQGDIKIQLATDAPNTVNSFAFLAGKGFYDGTIFFYVKHDYVAQAGDPSCKMDSEKTCSGVGGPGYTLKLEQSSLKHDQWAVVAPTIAEGGEEIHGSQFRILFQPDNERLDGKETVFGKVIEGQQVLEGIPDFEACSTASGKICDEDASSALVIQRVIVQPA